MKTANELIKESSLYLQQHAHNPVKWFPWSESVFQKAKEENKIVLISVGYSACHWCHVMEHECFEDEEVAALMNAFFVCVKVDREERPDVDQVYMQAVQLMTQRGGWPLNCFTLPDGRPIYGGTYFPKEQWMHVLKSLHHTFTSEPEKCLEYAMELTNGVAKYGLIEAPKPIQAIEKATLDELVKRWLPRMDNLEGGPTHAPKFPLPVNYSFLIDYATIYSHEALKKHCSLTLHKMAWGGIYDQVGGGFSRYSVDMLWKIPHFEKMLYDNGQLLSLYAKAYTHEKSEEYLRVLKGIRTWITTDLLNEENSLSAAQDADSEGEEGKFYVWKKEQLKTLLGEHYSWFQLLFNPDNKGDWEHDNYVLIRNESWESFRKKHPLVSEKDIVSCLEILYSERKKRIAPVTDEKILTTWNALTITGLCHAFCATNDAEYLLLARKVGESILKNLYDEVNGLWHVRQNGTTKINGFLDDYSTFIEAALQLYQFTAEEKWLSVAEKCMQICFEKFQDKHTSMFYFTNANSDLIVRKMEIQDNVIPASNSIMAHNLLELSLLTDNELYYSTALQMYQNVAEGIENSGENYANWARFALRIAKGVSCIHAPKNRQNAEILPILSAYVLVKYVENDFYTVCGNGSCSAPMESLEEVKEEINL